MLQTLPNELKQPYEDLVQSYYDFNRAREDYLTSKLPRYVSIPQFYSELGLLTNYDEMKELAFLAEGISVARGKTVKRGESPIGVLYCYLEEILDEAFDEMTLED